MDVPDLLTLACILRFAMCVQSGDRHQALLRALYCSAINALSVCGLPFEYVESSSWTKRFAEQQAATAYNALTVCLTELRVDLIRINIWIDPSLATMLIATAQFL